MPTLKKLGRTQFFAALDTYRDALISGDSARIVASSVAIHAAKGLVPCVNRTMRSAMEQRRLVLAGASA
jgi:hypothetical protein